MNIQKNFYAIMGGPWKKGADEECRRSQSHDKSARKAQDAIGEELGMKVGGMFYRSGWSTGITVCGVHVDNASGLNLKSLGLRVSKKAEHIDGFTAVAPYRNKKMDWMWKLLKEMNHDGFIGFLDEYDGFPFGQEIIGVQMYSPQAWHSQRPRKEPRTLMAIGHDADSGWEPEGLPDGVYQVTKNDGVEWVNHKCELEVGNGDTTDTI
jgi:hypothetical protein